MVVSQHQSIMIRESSGTLNQPHTTLKHNTIEKSHNSSNNQIHRFQLAHPRIATSPTPSTACCSACTCPPRQCALVQFTSITTTSHTSHLVTAQPVSLSTSQSLNQSVIQCYKSHGTIKQSHSTSAVLSQTVNAILQSRTTLTSQRMFSHAMQSIKQYIQPRNKVKQSVTRCN